MKKKFLIFIIILFVALSTTGCGKKQNKEIKLDQIKKINNLATLKTYYHNVAKIEKVKGKGITHLGETDRKYWIEYTGIVKLGIKTDKMDIKVDGNNVEILMPHATVLSMHHEDYDESSIYMNKDSRINKNQISTSDINEAFKKADKDMKDKLNSNKELFKKAEASAEAIIENFIKNIGKEAGIDYNVNFKYIN